MKNKPRRFLYMSMKALFSLLLCACLLLSCGAALGEEVTLSVRDQSFSASSDAVEIDLGEMKLPDTDEAYEALEEFIRQMPSLTRLDMFSTDIPVNRVLYLGEKYPQIRFGWTILIPCKNTERKDRPPEVIEHDGRI